MNLSSIVKEFKEDLGKQAIVLMGLPAAGKSTFINKDLHKYFPAFKDYKVTNSDLQVVAAQHHYATNQYNWLLKNIKSSLDLKKFIEKAKYVDNDGNLVKLPITYQWWIDNKDKGFKHFYKTFFKLYYATYFDIRDLARAKEKQLFATKVKTSGDLLIIDTVASVPAKILGRLDKTKENGFTNTIIYLEINPDLAIQRDTWRKENEGRGVGASIIMSYAKNMESAYSSYKKEGDKKDGVIDRLIHFKWKPSGKSPVDGEWIKIEDNRYALKRKLKGKQ